MIDYTELTKAGMDMDEFRRRLMGNDALVKVFVGKFAADTTFAALETAFDTADEKAAEMASHTLKGMSGNLALHTLFDMFTAQVNAIRAGDMAGAQAMMAEITPLYKATVAAMQGWLAAQ